MIKPWIYWIFAISFFFLAALKSHEFCALKPFFPYSKSIKIDRFGEVKKGLSLKEQDLLELWESMLTGRTAPLARWMKDRYKLLGLNHLFTPSGFHLSAVLLPFMKLIKSNKYQLILLLAIGLGLLLVPGQGALKRMVLIKTHQKILGLKLGFILALIVDCLFGTFQHSASSFSYSFLFLGIIYSGFKGSTLVIWFFIAQVFLSYFQASYISPLIILLSPLLNFAFGLAMPLLFLLALPLWSWQLWIGLKILGLLQFLVDRSAEVIQLIPVWETHFGVLLLVFLFIQKKWRFLIVSFFLLSSSLNLDQSKTPGLGSNEFVPMGKLIRTTYSIEKDVIYFSDGKCERRLSRGIWWEKCSPFRSKTGRKST